MLSTKKRLETDARFQRTTNRKWPMANRTVTSITVVKAVLTFLYVIAPTTAGPMNPGRVANVLVRPISVPTIVGNVTTP